MELTKNSFALVGRFWNSPTLMTWLNLSARMLSLVVVLPLVLRNFESGDVALFFLFAAAISLQMMTAGGFVSSFSRFVSYALAGADEKDLAIGRFYAEGIGNKAVSGRVVARIRGTMRWVFAICALVSFVSLVFFGTWLLSKPIEFSTNPTQSWIAWCVILIASSVSLFGMRFNAFLQGANKIALEQRWSALFSIFASISGITVLLCGGGLMALIISNQVWLIVGYFRNRYLEMRLISTVPYLPTDDGYEKAIFLAVWGPSWRSLVGIMMSNGVMQMSGFLYAHFLSKENIASYLLALRLITVISEVSRAPFYSKIPFFNSLRASGNLIALKNKAFRSMHLAHGLYIIGATLVGVFGAPILDLLGSTTDFADPLLWSLLSVAFLVERFGAMHIQIYSTTNHIIWHIANGISGGITIILFLMSIVWFEIYAFPVAMIFGYLSYYSTIVPIKSLRSLKTKDL